MVVDDDVIFSVFKKYCKVCNRSQVSLATISDSDTPVLIWFTKVGWYLYESSHRIQNWML